MSNTSQFQIYPDYYPSIQECIDSKYKSAQTNSRYRNFKQTHFTAGDEQQFQEYRNQINGSFVTKKCLNKSNIFKDIPLYKPWDCFTNVKAVSVINTFRYLFHKFKKAIFIKIKDNKLSVFLPFSKEKYVNEWSDKIHVNPSYKSMSDFIKHIADLEGMTKHFSEKKINAFINNWYANNCLIRYEFPLGEGDSGVCEASNMFQELCEKRALPDIEFFVNRRDFPLLKRDKTEPYHNIFGNYTTPLVSHKYDKYIPILSNVTDESYADIAIPTWEDWCRVQSFENKYFVDNPRTYKYNFEKVWEEKKNIAVFRGGSTGCGVAIDTNMRLKVAYLSSLPENNQFLDAGITKWNLRPRKIMTSKYLETIEKDKLPFGLVEQLTPEQQSEYKYIINIDGHVSAFRLSLELNMGSVVLLVTSNWKIWFFKFLVPYVHYVPVKADLSDLIDQIKWCQNNDEKCKEISENSRKFYNIYLTKDGILDYLQKLLFNLKTQIGNYVYNYKTPLQLQLDSEKLQLLVRKLPEELNQYSSLYLTDFNIYTCPSQPRSFGLLKGLEYLISMILEKHPKYLKDKLNNDAQVILAQTKTSTILEYKIGDYDIAIKKTTKIDENTHEAFIGINCINELIKNIPNFSYTFGVFLEEGSDLFLLTEKIEGITFTKYLESREFKIKEYLFILIQLSLALQVAQRSCEFVHWDLYAWNVIIQKLPDKRTFDYQISPDKVIRIKTNIIPVIIDYGKSHVVFNNEKYGFINMYKKSTIQDILTIVISSLYKLLLNDKSTGKLSKRDKTVIVTLSNFFTNTKYKKVAFKHIGEILHFLHMHHSFAEIISSDKYELEQKTPVDFINYIMNIQEISEYDIKIIDTSPVFTLNIGDPIQVFEYILSKTESERLKTFRRSFKRARKECKECKECDSKHSMFDLENRVTSVYEFFTVYIKQINLIDPEFTLKITNKYKKILEKIKVTKQSQKESKESLDFKESKDSTELQLQYNEESFYDMEAAFSLIKKAKAQTNSNCNTFVKTAKLIASTNLSNIPDLPQPIKNLYQCIIKL